MYILVYLLKLKLWIRMNLYFADQIGVVFGSLVHNAIQLIKFLGMNELFKMIHCAYGIKQFTV